MAAVALMVMEVETFSSGMLSKRVSMSSRESMATPTLPTSPRASGMVGVHANLRGEIEGYGEAGLAFAEQIAIALVGFDGGAEARVLAHGPEAAAVHRWIDAAGVGEFAGVADGRFWIRGGEIVLRVEAIDGEAGERREVLFAFGGGLGFCVGHFRGHRMKRKVRG